MKAEKIVQAIIASPKIRTQTRLAEICRVKPQAIQCWTRVPAQHCRAIEYESGGHITRYQMRPDVFGNGPNDVSDLSAA